MTDNVPRTQAFGERTVYDNRWVRLTQVEIEPPDGRRFWHHVVRLQRIALAAILDSTGEALLMTQRHRWAIDTVGWELPGGIVEQGESGAECAAREAEEETGWRPDSTLQHILSFEPMPGMVVTPHEIYLGRGATQVGEPTDLEEAGLVEWVDLSDAAKLARSGQIAGSGSLVAVLHILAFGVELPSTTAASERTQSVQPPDEP